MSSNDPKAMGMDGFDHLVYVRLFEGCNLACQHCFIPANPKKMEADHLARLPDDFAHFAKPGDTILIQWHGGEPTLLGPDIIRQSIDGWIKKYPQYHLKFGIQTNLMNFDQAWAKLYHDHFGSHIGISWDPKIRLLKKNQPQSNEKFERVFWRKVAELVQSGIEPYLVVTGTRIFFESFPNPHDFFTLLEKNSIKSGHIERLTKTGVARDNWDSIGLNNLENSRYMIRFARAYHQYLSTPRPMSQMPVRLSPFDGLFDSIIRLRQGKSGGSGCLSGICDTRFHTFDASGYKRGCTAITSEYDNRNAGVQVIKIMDLEMDRIDRQRSCDGCPFLTICSSGCMASDKWDESGECSGGSRLFTELEVLI